MEEVSSIASSTLTGIPISEHLLLLRSCLRMSVVFYSVLNMIPVKIAQNATKLFGLQIMLQIAFFFASILCFKTRSRCIFWRAAFCAPNQIVLQMDLFACNFLWSRSLKIACSYGFVLEVAPALSLLATVKISFFMQCHVAAG